MTYSDNEIQHRSKNWPVFVLTLEGDDDRRADLVKCLDQNGVLYELAFGVDGRKGLPPDYEFLIDRPKAKRRYRRSLSDAEFACALSHRSLYEEIVKNRHGGAVILEDDAVPTEAFFEFLEQHLYLKSDMIMLDHSHARVIGPSIQLNQKISARKLSLPSCLTTAYSLSFKSAQYLLDAASPVSDVADWPGDVTKQYALACDPTVVKHPDPIVGSSHLRSQRSKVKSDPLRFLQRSFWQVWLTKRKSERIS